VIETIRRLVEAYGPSGSEGQTRAIIQSEVESLADDVTVDALGNLIAWKRSANAGARTVMLAAHMDEIGVMVTHVDKEGYLRFTDIGGLRTVTLIGNRVRFENGVIGAIGVQGDFDGTKAPRFEDLFIDVSGADTIRVGDAAGFWREMVVRGDRLVAKSMDDRIGCAVLVETLRRLTQSPHHVAFVFSTQEEVGLRGAHTSAYAIDPAIAISVDVTRTGDFPKARPMAVALGEGPAIKVKDGGMLAAPEVRALMERAAKRSKVPYQLEVLTAGTTDAASMQLVREGVLAGCLSIPCRYVHTVSETVDLNDVQHAVTLLTRLLSDPV